MQPFVLVVDDEPDLGEMLQTALGIIGCRSAAETTLTGGLTRAALDRPDLVLLDNHFPEGHGDEIVPALRIALPHTPIIIITANESDFHVRSALLAGARQVLSKPFSLAQLRQVVQESCPGLAGARVA